MTDSNIILKKKKLSCLAYSTTDLGDSKVAIHNNMVERENLASLCSRK